MCCRQPGFVAVAVLVMISIVACAGPARVLPLALKAGGAVQARAEPAKEPAAESTGTPQAVEFNPDNFDNSAAVTNPWLPLTPGTRFVYEGKAIDDSGELIPHRIEVNVTDLTKMIGGVRALVTWDQDYSDDALEEAELAFYAQDKDGNVWYMGEYPEAYQDEKLAEVLTWIHGYKDAQAGIMMPAKPQLDTPSYAEGWGPEVGWSDIGQVDQMGQKTCVPVKCYEDVLVIAESSQAEPDAQQLKYYAQGVGNVRVDWRGSGEKTQETLELIKIEQLSAEEMAAVREGALALEKSAYANSKDVYANTAPLEQGAPQN